MVSFTDTDFLILGGEGIVKIYDQYDEDHEDEAFMDV